MTKEEAKEVWTAARSQFDKIPMRVQESFEEWWNERQQVNSVDLADVGERKPTYNDGLRKELEMLEEKRDAALSSSAIRYWEREIQRFKKRLYC